MNFNDFSLTPFQKNLEDLSNFYGISVYDLVDDNYNNIVRPKKPFHGLHPEDVTEEDFDKICQFGILIKKYKKQIQIDNLPPIF